MTLADELTAAAVLAAAPCYPVPPSGRSPAIDALRAAPAGQGLAIGRDGVMLILRRPWLEVDVPVTPPIRAYLPYGSIGEPRAVLRCGLIPAAMLGSIIDHLRVALPDEAGAFVTWDENTREFAVAFPEIDAATPSRLIYRTPILAAGQHLVCDIHSHGSAAAFFSATDDADDMHSTKIALVFGNLDARDGPTIASRLCAGGMFLPMPLIPFAGDHHAA
ncbi:PRTRC system protein A [uncultured Sphingomonas sp.]|uniref:PRTRC system protein A n=1 Tax=uncultured Sphingomonas sp. TaxID=158754 RepID=UPI0025EEDD0A|nr:PRTRC system protein A [uncultured Sphingomonas sp.]